MKTTGDLRTYLVGLLESVRSGGITPLQASQMVKIAEQINESFYAEVKVRQAARDADETVKPLGQLHFQ